MYIISIVTLSIFAICWIVYAFISDNIFDMLIMPLLLGICIIIFGLLFFSLCDLFCFIYKFLCNIIV